MRSKYSIEQYFTIFIWCIILVLTIFIIEKSVSNSIQDNSQKHANGILEDYFSDFGMHLLGNSSTLIDYSMQIPPESVSDNAIINILCNIFPIQQYLLEQTDIIAAETSNYIVSNSIEALRSWDEVTTTYTLNPSEEQDGMEVIGNDIYYENDEEAQPVITTPETKEAMAGNLEKISTLKSNSTTTYLIKNFYTVNNITGIDKNMFKVSELLQTDLRITKNNALPQILIYHTHAHEAFADSKKGETDDTIVGVGRYLTKILTEKYGYNVIHNEKAYDANHPMAYSTSLPDIEKILQQNPTIQVVLDLHRDAGYSKTNITINGKKTAKIMFFNGVSRNNDGPIDYLYNPNLKSNLSFSLQMKLIAMQKYPNFTKRIFLRSYRYNMHLMDRYSLVEVGDNLNTVEEVKNAMEPFADILNEVLTTK